MKSYSIKNFRNYKNVTKVELNKINIFLGENNIGKSSFLRILPMLKQTIEMNSNLLEWFGPYVDLDDNSKGKTNIEIELDLTDNKESPHKLSRILYGLEENITFNPLIYKCVFKENKLTKFIIKGYGVYLFEEGKIRYSKFEDSNFKKLGDIRENKLKVYSLFNISFYSIDSEELKVLKVSFKRILYWINNITYISGQRTYGERYSRSINKKEFTVSSKGDNIEQVLKSLSDRDKKKLNEFLNEKFSFKIDFDSIHRNYGGLKIKLGENSYNIVDLGSGYSQVLPIIINLFLNSQSRNLFIRNKTIIIEQPELHLHPKLQKDLVKILYEMVKEFDIQLIIETHSPDILYMLSEMEFQNAEDESFTSIFNVEKENEINKIKKYSINKEGVIEWPRNFLS